MATRRLIGLCLAAAAATVLLGAGPALASTEWSAPTNIEEGFHPSSVSCPSTSFCAATDYRGNVLTFRSNPPPSSTSPPSISGSALAGDLLIEAPGAWTNSPAGYSYQWQDCDASGNNCTAIPGATGQSYLLTDEDVGHTIRVEESTTNGGGSGGPAASDPTRVVKSAPGAACTAKLGCWRTATASG